MLKQGRTLFYHQIADTVRSRIQSGQYAPNMLIPPAHKLAKEFGVSDITIRNAMDILVREGAVVRQRGLGTRVNKTNNIKIVRQITSIRLADWFYVPLFQKRQSVDVLEMTEIDCPQPIQEILKLSASDKVIKMKRIMKLDSEPIACFINYFSPSLFQKSAYRKFSNTRFLKVLFQETDSETISVEREIAVCVADVDLANNLHVHFGDPLFRVSTTYRMVDGTSLAFTQGYHRGDRTILKETNQVERRSVNGRSFE